MIRWIKQRRAEEARMAEEEQRRLAVSSGQHSVSPSLAEVAELEGSSDDDVGPEKKRSRTGFHPILRKEMIKTQPGGATVECPGKFSCSFKVV